MWPNLLDYSRDECKHMLRRMELDAYSSIVSVFRAQGDLSKDKKKVLQDLQNMLSISIERHRAEVRRAVNDERLTTVADSISGSSATPEWLIEGRRLVPLLPRLVPQTAFTQTANQMAKDAVEKNAQLINPALTGNRELANQASVTPSAVPSGSKPSRPSSPTSNVVVLPSGTSIHIKGMLNQDEDDDQSTRRQRRSLSIDGLGAATVSTQTQTARVVYTTASSTPGTASPVKITISKSPQGRTIVSQPGGQPPKVILVTSSGQSSGSSMFQRSMSVPVIRASTSTTTSQTGTTRTSIIIPGSPAIAQSNSSMPGVVTVTTTSITTSSSATVTMPTSVVGASPVFSPSVNIGKPRPKVVPRQRFPQPQTRPGVVIPMGPTGSQPVAPSPQSIHNIQVKTMPKPPPIQIKQEGGMKIITQSVGGASKILPKPAQMGGSPGTPVVVVNAGPSSSTGNTTVTMVPKTVGSYTTTTGSKVLNITTPGGRVIATTTKASNVVTVNPKTLHLTAVKSAAGGTTVSKPNVIVVQKTQPRRPQIPAQVPKGGTTVITSPAAFEKELANFIQKESGRQVSVSISPSGTVSPAASVGGRVPEHRVIITTAGSSDPGKQIGAQKIVTDAEGRTSSLLAELIQAAGIVPEGSGESSGGVGGNEWFEYDVAEDSIQPTTSESLVPPAVQTVSVLPDTGSRILQRRGSTEDQLSRGAQEQFYTAEPGVSLLPAESQAADMTSDLAPQPAHQIAASEVDTSKIAAEISSRLSSNVSSTSGVTVVQRLQGQPDSTSGRTAEAVAEAVQQGELDPQTGLFYSSLPSSQLGVVGARDRTHQQNRPPPTSQSIPTQVQQQQPQVSVESSAPAVAATTTVSQSNSSQPMDLLSSSLAQAQIDLGSYEFGEESLETFTSDLDTQAGDSGVENGGAVNIDQQQLTAAEAVENFDTTFLEDAPVSTPSEAVGQVETVPQESSIGDALPVSSIAQLGVSMVQPAATVLSTSLPAARGRPSAFIPLEDVKEARSSGINITKLDQGDLVRASTSVSGLTNTSTTSSSSLSGSKFITSTSASATPTIAISVSSSQSSLTSLPQPTTPASAGAAVANSGAANLVSVSMSLVRTNPSKPIVVSSSLPQTVVLENPSVGVDISRTPAASNSVASTAVAGTVHYVSDGHGTGINVQVDGHKQVDLSVLPSGASVSTGSVDFTSTGEDEVNLISVTDSGNGEGVRDGLGADAGNSLRHSKRKRKPPSALEEAAVGSAGGSWVRAASNILWKVSRFRGTHREKGELNAAAWFTQPVDPADAPDYYSIIKSPMDFATIRKKLEGGQYAQFDDFHADMLLVRSNCFLYNPPNTRVCRDCVQVFNFYQQEIDRLLDKSANKVQSSPQKKVVRLDKSPGKS
ncbi:hypothetical protein BaRGS_00009479 [Batillaria attramentaria]|uniref:Bromo domain-containing protein n=1 Tax=Batillaria attramentaria TaxID=370345 RepID=A0ABD0LI50_9CAEN